MKACVFLLCWGWLLGQVAAQPVAQPAKPSPYGGVIYGATPAGIMAAISAAGQGHSVALVEEYPHIGGLMTSGVAFTDFVSFEVLSGSFLDYTRRVERYYAERYGKDSPQVRDSHWGIHAEPKVTEQIFHQMLAEHPRIRLLTNRRLVRVETEGNKSELRRIRRVQVQDRASQRTELISGQVFIDATYEGDLAALAGAEYRVGRESQREYGERYAGRIFTRQGVILNGSTGEGDRKIQSYNFRLIMSRDSANRRMIEPPADYRRETYLPMVPVLQSGRIRKIFTPTPDGIIRERTLPNGKADINDIKNAPVRLALLGQNYDYPEGSPAVRERIIRAHRDHILGFLYFIQNDPAVPDSLRLPARAWGLARDEFVDNDNFPYRLYVREARRVMGEYVFTEKDTYLAPNSVRTVLKPDAIAIGDYALNCHGVSPPGELYPDITEGDFNHIPPPFQIPYGTIVPRRLSNLLVPVALSASHVGFSALRLEPTWAMLGQAAGLAAHLAIGGNQAVRAISVPRLQELLHGAGVNTIYASDLTADSPYFRAAQYWGTRGLFHGLVDPRTAHLVYPPNYGDMQYRKAFPYHALEPDRPMDEALSTSWLRQAGITDPALRQRATTLSRGQFLNELYQRVGGPSAVTAPKKSLAKLAPDR